MNELHEAEKEKQSMGNVKNSEKDQSELVIFLKETRENFLAAGKPKSGWLSNMLKKLFG